jgi:hypothetical protein
MTKAELFERLADVPDGQEIMILDGSNAGGFPRDINVFSERTITATDAQECADCEDFVGTTVFVLGYGFY